MNEWGAVMIASEDTRGLEDVMKTACTGATSRHVFRINVSWLEWE